jgi:hypothetical protein
MSITIHQKRGIAKINDCFNKLEKIAADYNIDLDVLMNVHKYEGVENLDEGKLNFKERTENRKRIFKNEQNIITYYQI